MSDVPEEVKAIFRMANKVRNNALIAAGWRLTCYRRKAVTGKRRCVHCLETNSRIVTKSHRNHGVKQYSGGKGRPPKYVSPEETIKQWVKEQS